MSREVDERIVAMYFDNKDFEKNAKTTIDTLGELKKELNIEKAAKGFDTLKKASENLKLDDMKRKVSNLQNVFAGLGRVIQKTFDIGTGPLHSLHNLFSTFQSYVTKFIGFDIAGKLVGSLESALRQLTVAPITTGFNEYEMKMDSIKTIMSGTGEDINTVTAKIQELNRYADQTIYSFSDMTSNIGKFTNNAVSLDDATSAIKGIANATADAGQSATQASMAMYNASQAMGVGNMKMIDWKSFENANIATVRLKETFMEAGVAHGKLVKEMDKASGQFKYYLVDPKTGKKAKAPKDQKGKWYEVTAENFRETLSQDWLDKESMLAGFKIFSGDLKTIADFRRMGFTEAMGFTDEDIQKLIEIGQNAQKAATEVRTFTKMYDALKEAAQSGWGESFEWIFGNMEEGTNLWTKLNDRISAMLEKSAEERNSALAEWRGMFQDHEGNWHKSQDSWVYEESYDEYGNIVRTRKQLVEAKEDGREVLMASFFEMIDILQEFGTTISDAWGSVFGKLDSDKLWAITNGFRDFVKGLREWMGSADDANSRLSKIRKGLTGVFGILKTVLNIGRSGVSLLTKLLKPLADLSVDLFGNFGKFFEGIGDMNVGDALKKIGEAFQRLWNKITNINWDTVKTKFSDAWASVKATLHEWLEANGLSGVWDTMGEWKNAIVEWFSGVRKTLEDAWGNVTKWFEDSGVAQFFRDAWGWIKEQFGVGGSQTNAADVLEFDELGNVVQQARNAQDIPGDVSASGFISTLNSVKTAVEGAWKTLTEAIPWAEIGQFFGDIWGWLKEQASAGWDTVSGFFAMDESGESGFTKLITNVRSLIDTTWTSIYTWGGWTTMANFFGDIWAWLKEKASAGWDAVSGFFEMDENKESGFTKLIGSIRGFVDSAWTSLYTWSGWSTMGKFFGDIWTFLKDKATGVWNEATAFFNVDENGESGFTKLIANIRGWVNTAWDSIYTWSGWSTMGKFFGDIWAFLESKANGLWNTATAFFELDSEGKSGFITMIEGLKEKVASAWNSIVSWEGWGAIGLFFGNTLEWIKSLVGGNTNAALGSEEGPAEVVKDMSEQVAKATEAAEADGGVEEKTSILERVLEALGNFWDKVQGFVSQITGNPAAAAAFDTFRKVLEIIAGIVSKVVNFLHKAVVQGDLGARIELIIGGISTLIASIYATKLKAKLASALSETEGVGEMVLKVASGIALIAAAVAVLSAIDETKMWRAVGAVSLITILVGAVIGIANDTKKVAPATDTPTTGLERIASKAISWVGMIGTLFVAMKELPEIIKSMKESNVTGEDLAGLGVFLATVVGGLSLITIVLGKIKLDPEQTATSAGAFVLGLGIIIAGLIAVFSIIPAIVDLVNPNITQGFVQKITETGNMLVAIGEAIGRFIASFSTGFKEEQNKNALENSKKDMQWLDEVAQEFGPERLQAIMRLITVFADLDNNLKGNLDKLNQVTDKLPGIGTNLAQFATNFQQVFMAKGGDITTVDAQLDRIWTMVKIYREVGELMEYIWITEKSAFDNNNLSRNIDNESSLKGMTSFLQMMLNAIQEGLGGEGKVLEFNATPIIDSIVVALGYGEDAIAAAVHAMVQAGIDNSGNPQKAGEYKNDILTKLVNGGFFGGGTDGGTTMPEIPTYEQIMQQTGLNNLMDPSKFATSMFGESGLNGIIEKAIGKIDANKLSTTMTTQLKPLGESFKNTFTIDNFNTQMGSFLPKNEKGEVDWENALKGFQDDMDLISEHLNEAGGMEVRITPVFEMTDLDKGRSQIEDYFRQNPLAIGMGDLTPNLTINLNNDTTLAMIRQTNENIAALADRMGNENASNISAINAMSSRIDGIASAVSNMRIYLDTGVLVGQVDKALGYNFFLAGRTGTTPGH